MDPEKSSNSSFEDLSNINDGDTKQATHNLLEQEKKAIKLNEIIATEESQKDKKDDNEEVKESAVTENKENTTEAGNDDVCDILGNQQLIKRIIKHATSEQRPTRGDLVTVTFTATLEDETVVEQEQNFQFHVGDYEVVQGLDMAVPLMNVGEVAEVTMDARFAYGSLGLKNEKSPERSIPANSKLIYVVHLLSAKTEEFSELRGFEVRKKYGSTKKERANFWYNRGEYNMAIQLYRRALEYLDDREGDPDNAMCDDDVELSNSDLQTLLEDRLVVYNNLAMAQIKISAFDAALKSVEVVLRCQPNNSKALYRKGRILESKQDTKGAIALLQKAATFEPESKIIQQDLAKLIIKARREEHNEKELYQKMLGQAKKLEQKNSNRQKQEGPDSSKLKLLGYLMGSILVGVAGVAFYRYKY